MSTTIARSKNFLQKRTLTSQDVKSFVDLVFKTSSIVSVSSDSATGLGSSVYSSTLSIGGNSVPVSVTGASTATIADLATAINTAVAAHATAVFIEAEQRIRVIANASGSVAISVSSVGTLPGAIVGTKQVGITASWGTPCETGGVNFELTNTATTDNAVAAEFISKARTSAGANIDITESYVDTTGILQVKKASGSFTAGDIVTVIGNLVG